MENEYYGAASAPTNDFLAHYGVKGMRWGVRKAIDTRNKKALDRHFQKAAKKLAKLQDIGLNPKKYAKISAAYGAAAAGTGTLAIAGIARKGSKMDLMDINKWRAVASPGNKHLIDKVNKPVKIAAGAVSAGLAGASALNAYRAANASKYRAKAVDFRNAMTDAFAGTKYAGKYVLPQQPRKRRKKSK